jgi:hypothetical protein
MQVKEHIAYGGAASLALYPSFGEKAVFFFLGSVLIDLDHYIDFLYYGRFRDWRIRNMFRFHGQMSRWKGRADVLALEAFHTAEFLALFLWVGLHFNSAEVLLLSAGMIFHLGLDLLRLFQHKAVGARALSFVEYWVRARRMRRAGVDPERVFQDAYASVVQGTAP